MSTHKAILFSGEAPVAVQCKLLVFLVLLSGALPAFAAGRVECSSLKSRYMPSAVGYCVLLPPGYDAQPTKKFPVLYFLHGLGGDHTFLVSSGAWNIIEDLQESKKIGEFVVIAPQANTTFYIDSKSGRTQYEDFFVHDLVPQMEKRLQREGMTAPSFSGILPHELGEARSSDIAGRLRPCVFRRTAAILSRAVRTQPFGFGMSPPSRKPPSCEDIRRV